MALVKVKTRLVPVKVMPGMFRVGYNLTCTDGGVEVINEDIRVVYKSSYSVPGLVAKLQLKGQAAIDKYLEVKQVYNIPAYQTAINNITLTG